MFLELKSAETTLGRSQSEFIREIYVLFFLGICHFGVKLLSDIIHCPLDDVVVLHLHTVSVPNPHLILTACNTISVSRYVPMNTITGRACKTGVPVRPWGREVIDCQ